MYQPKMALINPTQVDRSPALPDSYQETDQAWRGSASLPRLYGRQLDIDCSHQDAFYALTQLFAISAFSVNRGLNLVEQCIDSQLKSSIEDMQISLENLHEAKSIVQNYISGLQRILEFIQTRESAKWPRATAPKLRALADAAAEELIHNYQHPLNRATSLAQRISSESQWLMHKAMLNEPQRAFSQGSRVARLTFLAFLFIPLSFTSSLFGMNIVELVGEAGPKVSVWQWAVLTAIVFAGSLLLWWWEAVLRFIKHISSKVRGTTAAIDKRSQ
jgi:Mg2+ and Co2+ transporter CorA